ETVLWSMFLVLFISVVLFYVSLESTITPSFHQPSNHIFPFALVSISAGPFILCLFPFLCHLLASMFSPFLPHSISAGPSSLCNLLFLYQPSYRMKPFGNHIVSAGPEFLPDCSLLRLPFVYHNSYSRNPFIYHPVIAGNSSLCVFPS